MTLLRDLFTGPGNKCWDLGRIASGWGFLLLTGALIWKAHAGQELNLVEVATGYAALLAGAGAFINLKDRVLRRALGATAGDAGTEPAA